MKKLMKLSSSHQINKSRELGTLLGSTLMQRRIIYSCLALMNPIVPEFDGMTAAEIENAIRTKDANDRDALHCFDIDLYDFIKTWNIGGNSIFEQLEKAIGYNGRTQLPDIMKTGFNVSRSGEYDDFIAVISRCKINREIGALSITLTSHIVPYLINLSSYTQIPFRATVGFKCNYSFTMLEFLLKRYVKSGSYPIHNVSLEDLHDILATSDTKSYKQWSNFKNFVLDKITKDFSQIVGGEYDIEFEPVIGEKRRRGRPSVERVLIKFNDTGIKRFRANMAARKAGADYCEENIDDIHSRAREAKAKYNLEKQKEKDKKDSKETLLSDKKAEEQLSLANLLNDDDDFDWNDENLPF